MDSTQGSKSFEQIGPAYDEVRPGYPESVYDRIVAFSSLLAPSRILEVGTGTGKATLTYTTGLFLARRSDEVVSTG
jgi:ubiquinone/menaquinone biosynthesis C-methylase UbiE